MLSIRNKRESRGERDMEEEVQEQQPQPQPQPPETSRTHPPGFKRLFVTLSILISVVAGIPFWWKLTEVYRAPLPFREIQKHATHVSDAALGLPCQLQVIFAVQPKNLDQTAWIEGLQGLATSIQQQVKNVVRDQPNGSICCGPDIEIVVSLDAGEVCERYGEIEDRMIWPCGLVQSGVLESSSDGSDDLVDDIFGRFSHQAPVYDPQVDADWLLGRDGGLYTIVVVDKAWKPTLRTVVGKHRHAWISGMNLEAPSRVEGFVNLIADVGGLFFGVDASTVGKVREGNSTMPNPESESMPLAADGAVILSFSLLNANPSDWIFTWDFRSVEDVFLKSAIEAMAPFAKLSVESQVLYYTPKAVQSRLDAKQRVHVINSKDLPFFVNANEWHLDTSIAAAGRSKLLHFAIYVPAAKECPLRLKLENGKLSSTNGFTSPGWGGVIIWNPPGCKADRKQTMQTLSLQDLEPVMEVVIAQLRSLFGLSTTNIPRTVNNIIHLPNLESGFAKWELDVLLRRRVCADISASASTLSSLSRLVQSLPNMVIKDEISNQVRHSLLAGATAQKEASLGAYGAAAAAAREARAWAEAAFFHPSIMSLLYFPAEHHFAIYTPFFVPVLLHIVISVFKELSRYVREHKTFYQAKKQR